MSYDLYLRVDVGGDEPATVSEPWNYTCNCAEMWQLAMPDTNGLAGMDGLTGAEAARHLRGGITAMETDPATYRALEPDNGWGDFDGQLAVLREWLAECERAPKAIMSVSK